MKRKNIIIISSVIAILIAVLIFSVKNALLHTAVCNTQVPEGSDKNASDLFKTVEILEEKQDLISARQAYLKFINDFPNDSRISEVIERLEGLNIKLIFSPIIDTNSFVYEVKPNDTLVKIAKENNTTVALIKKSNSLGSDTIRPGLRLKILKAKFTIFIDKSQDILTLKKDEEVIKNYLVSTGVNNSTPIGKFKIVNKIVAPVWFKAGAVVPPESPENILGSRWMGLDLQGYGIHGTTEPETIGQQVTQGCVRMLNRDVEELFDILPVDTEVTIVD